MKQEINLLKVPFFGAELLLVEHNEQPYVVMKTITESIGLSWQGQHEKLLEHFSKGIKEILIPTNGGVQQMICMNLRKFPAWLYSLQPKKISDPIKRAKIIAFRSEKWKSKGTILYLFKDRGEKAIYTLKALFHSSLSTLI